MKVLHVVRQFYPAVGGLENFVFNLVKEQNSNGMQADVLTLNTVYHHDSNVLPDSETQHGFLLKRIPWFGSYKYPFAFDVINHISEYDLIHIHGVDFFLDFLSATRFFHRKKLVLSTHGGFFHTNSKSILKKIFFNVVTRFSLRNICHIYACSDGDYEKFYPLSNGRITKIENGVDVDKFSGVTRNTMDTGLNFVFIGRFSDNKRIDLLISMFFHLHKLNPSVKLFVIGKDWDGNLQGLSEQIIKLSLVDNVFIMTGLSDVEIEKQLRVSDFIVSASEYEGFGISLVEGMSAGLIPIASNIDSFTKIINNSGIGLLTDFNNEILAAHEINAYINKHISELPKLREAVRQSVSVYSWHHVSSSFISAYNSVVGNSQRVIQSVIFDTRNQVAVFDHLDECIANKNRIKVAIANAHTVNLCRNNNELLHVIQSFLVLNDGFGVDIASRLRYGKGFVDNLNGTDLIPSYLSSSSRSLSIYLLGATEDVVSKCFTDLSSRYPQHRFVGYHNGYFSVEHESKIVDEIAALNCDLLLVAMGNPKQELWIENNYHRANACVMIGVGAFFDFVSGEVPRAPVWVRKMKMEWIFRLCIEPRRMWRRYLIGNVVFLYFAFKERKM